jgi:hypothetical protein
VLLASTILATIAVLLGLTLALLFAHGTAYPAPVGWLHGALGVAGLVLLLLALRGPPRGVEMGAGHFGIIAAWLLALALLFGLLMLGRALRRGTIPGAAVGIHATLAIAGFVMLVAYASL